MVWKSKIQWNWRSVAALYKQSTKCYSRSWMASNVPLQYLCAPHTTTGPDRQIASKTLTKFFVQSLCWCEQVFKKSSLVV